MKIKKSEMPFTPSDCEYSSECYNEKYGSHYRCNFVKNTEDSSRPLCDLKSGELWEKTECSVFHNG